MSDSYELEVVDAAKRNPESSSFVLRLDDDFATIPEYWPYEFVFRGEVIYRSGKVDGPEYAATSTFHNYQRINNLLWGWTDWKQIRNQDHPRVKSWRRYNQYDIANEETYEIKNIGVRGQFASERETSSYFVEPIFDSNQTFKHTILDSTREYHYEYSYKNEYERFANEKLCQKMGNLEIIDKNYKFVYDKYKFGNDELKELEITDNLFPQGKFIGTEQNRIRSNFEIGYWDSDRDERNSLESYMSLLGGAYALIHDDPVLNGKNALGYYVHKKSVWPLDAKKEFETNSGFVFSSAAWTEIISGTWEGELQSKSQFGVAHKYQIATTYIDAAAIRATPLYARAQIEETHKGILLAGDTKWETADQAGIGPFVESYRHYNEMIKNHGKDFSLIPEFRISEHLSTYDGDYFKEISGSFVLSGSDLGTSENLGFEERYMLSDIVTNDGLTKDDHHDYHVRHYLKLETLNQFLPYDKLYPVLQTLSLVEKFSTSYGDYITGSGAGNGNVGDYYSLSDVQAQVARRTFYDPLFGPGILFNTIKSCVAVDYPIMTGSGQFTINDTDYIYTHQLEYPHTLLDPYPVIEDEDFHYRLPFETLIEPSLYGTVEKVVDSETHSSASSDLSASWGGQGSNDYKLAANNFFAEVPNFFLKDGNLTSARSLKDTDPNFGLVDGSVEVYEMLVILHKEDQIKFERGETVTSGSNLAPYESGSDGSITIYDNRKAFGNPTSLVKKDVAAPFLGYAPYTPPYYDGPGLARIKFTPTSVKKYTLAEIFEEIEVEYLRYGWDCATYFSPETGRGGTFNYPSAGGMSYGLSARNRMEISSSVNLFSIAGAKDVEYDEKGIPSIIKDNSSNGAQWVIQTKFETPVLDFSDCEQTIPEYGSGSIAKGMWHQYGSIVSDDKSGLVLEISDIAEVMKTPIGGETGSLADLVGFAKKRHKIGEIADEKVFYEAIVAIPFEYSNYEKIFYEIPSEEVDKDVYDKFVFPPRFDLKRNKKFTKDAIRIFTIEFDFRFTKEDLSHIWQNIAPWSHLNFEKKDVLFDLGEFAPNDKTRWLFFKVKQRAKTNYWEMLETNLNDERYKFNFKQGKKGALKTDIPDFSYNWPYDEFSMIELAKISLVTKVTGKDE